MNSYSIAVVTDDGINISQHFGRAKFFEVIFIENGKVVKKERRDKPGHHSFAHNESHEHQHGEHRGFGNGSHNKHIKMADVINECDYVITRGMGAGAYQSMMQLNIRPIVTDIKIIDEAVQEVINGKIVDHTEKLH
jgi:predicted Fe-Mo cluster-binding NifX family protein